MDDFLVILGAALGLYLSAAQVHWLNVAYDEGQKYGLPHYTQAIILVESSACLHKRGDDGRSLGCGQLQINTADKMCGCKLGPTRLATENVLNIKLTARFLSACFERFWPDKNRAISCYNVGPFVAAKLTNRSVAKSRYVARVLKALSELAHVRQTED